MKHPRTHVTDHALLRYLERVLHVDIETHRRAIGRLVDQAAKGGASGVVIDGMAYRIVKDKGVPVVVTIRPANSPDIRHGRKPRHRGGTT